MESDHDYNYNTSDEECDPDTWEDEGVEEEDEEQKEITYKVCFLIIFRFYHFDCFPC